MKEIFLKLKELWQIPRYNGLLKLGLYIGFFVLCFGILNIVSLFSEPEVIEEKSALENYIEMNNYEYTYNISYIEKNKTIENIVTGIKYQDKNDFNYLKKKYYIVDDVIYSKDSNEIITDLLPYDLTYLEPTEIYDILISAIEISRINYQDNSSKKEYKLEEENYSIYITTYEEKGYITKIVLDVSEYVNTINNKITSYIVEISYTNINNISSYN